jgi:toxin HigB-1
LENYYNHGEGRKLPADMLTRIRVLLHALADAEHLDDLSVASYRLHPLKGGYNGFWSITVRANWRIIFRFERGNVYDVDFLDYH